MFIERYHDLLEDGGRLLSVIDDSMLAGKDFGFVRNFHPAGVHHPAR